MNERMLTVAQVAERLQASPATLRAWLRTGKLHGVRMGGTKLGWRIPTSEVERLQSLAASLSEDWHLTQKQALRMRAALEYIAHFDDESMGVARTLHYDMRGRARAALAD